MENTKRRLTYRGADGRTLTIYALPAVARVLLRNDRWSDDKPRRHEEHKADLTSEKR